jgi:multicomponent Na+:H+ antiporter subunit G
MVAQLGSMAGTVLLGIGTLFCLLGVYGVMRMPDIYNRIQAAGLVITMGAGSVFLSLVFLAPGEAALRGVATAAFLSLTAPMATHVLARTAYRHGVPLAEETARNDLAEDEGDPRAEDSGDGDDSSLPGYPRKSDLTG